jgi:predicted lipoprotein with Yx(FWY)xxD motif
MRPGGLTSRREKKMTASHTHRKAGIRRPRNLLLLGAAATAAGAVALSACGSSGNSASGSSTPAGGSASASAAPSSAAPSTAAPSTVSAAGLKTAKIGGVSVLTNAKGFALYTFAPDTSTKSACNGACAKAWPPVKASSGVSAPFATIKRSDGSTQLTFHGHPLYTYIADTSPGKASGNNVNAFGGLWLEAPASGGSAAGTMSSSSGGT